ncbi:MAG: hypothetical protein QXK50_04575 [Ignisphaera sp.]
MNRGQSEYIGATLLILLTILITYLSTEWMYTIGSVAREAVNNIEKTREVLDIYLESSSIRIVNRGIKKCYLDLMYIELVNRTIIIRDTNVSLAGGGEIAIALDVNDVEKVCIETRNGNTFCSHRASDSDSYRDFMYFERIPPTYLGFSTVNHVPYRVKRVVAPETYFHIYTTSEGYTTIVIDSEEILNKFSIYLNDNTSDIENKNYIAITLYDYTILDLSKLMDHDDSTAGIIMYSTIAELEICINFDEITRGWFYVYMVNRGGAQGGYMYIAISNNTCRYFETHSTLYSDVAGRNIKGVWLINARSIKIYIKRLIYDIYSIEFYPYNATKTSLGFPSTRYSKPVNSTITVFATSNTYLHMVELIKLNTAFIR